MNPAEINRTVDELINLYQRHGADDYIGEPVSLLEHMSQSAHLAEQEGYDDEVILAAFFHDIGHICSKEEEHGTSMGDFGTLHHEQMGARFLRAKGFSERIARLVENHVPAKRYLTYKFPEYFEKLSLASKETLAYQGGRMTEGEATDFEQNDIFEESIRLRKWDELAKEVGQPTVNWQVMKARCIRHLQDQANI